MPSPPAASHAQPYPIDRDDQPTVSSVSPRERDRRRPLEALLSSPRILQVIFRVLRFFPAFRVPGGSKIVLVSRAADVRVVMERDQDFGLAHFNAPVMPGGPFILGMDRAPRWFEERRILEDTLGDADRVWAESFAFAKAVVDRARDAGRIDMVGDLALPLALNTASQHFGVPPPDPPLPGEPRRPEPAQLVRWLRKLVRRIISDPQSEAIRGPADEAAGELAAYVDDLIAFYRDRLKRGESIPETVLTRILKKRDVPIGVVRRFLDAEASIDRATDPEARGRALDEMARRSVIGEISAGTPTVVKAATQALDQLLRHPEALAQASAAARSADEARLRQLKVESAPEGKAVFSTYQRTRDLRDLRAFDAYINEALRFHPVFPLLRRYTPRKTSLDRVIDTGWLRERFRTLHLAPDLTILVFPMSAMYDRRELASPETFRLDRHPDLYFHYGKGIHHCLGADLAHAQLLAITSELVRLAGLRREPGEAGRIQWDGPSPHRLVLRFDRP